MLNVTTDTGSTLRTIHLVFDGLSQWIVDRSVTSLVTIEHVGRSVLAFPIDEKESLISLVDRRFLSFIELSRFIPPTRSKSSSSVTSEFTLSFLSAASLADSPWPLVKKMIDNVQ